MATVTQTIIKFVQADGTTPMRGYKCKIMISKNGIPIGKPLLPTTSNAGIINVRSGFGLTIAVIIMKDGKAKQLDTFVSSSTIKPTYHEIKAPKVSVKNCKYKDGAIDIAKYIVEEIKKNANSQVANDMRYWNDYKGIYSKKWDESDIFARPISRPGCGAFQTKAIAKWREMVNANHIWDHKPIIKNKFQKDAVEVTLPSGKTCTYCYHKYKNNDYFYDVWSNIHYGYVGMSCGFSEDILTLGSTAQQFMHSGNFDTSDDKATMILGIELYKKFDTFALKLTAQDVLNALETCKLSESRQIHWCNNPKRLR